MLQKYYITIQQDAQTESGAQRLRLLLSVGKNEWCRQYRKVAVICYRKISPEHRVCFRKIVFDEASPPAIYEIIQYNEDGSYLTSINGSKKRRKVP